MTILEIEDSKGNTILSMKIEHNIKPKDITIKGGNIADEDNDYIFNSEHRLIRIQQY